MLKGILVATIGCPLLRGEQVIKLVQSVAETGLPLVIDGRTLHVVGEGSTIHIAIERGLSSARFLQIGRRFAVAVIRLGTVFGKSELVAVCMRRMGA